MRTHYRFVRASADSVQAKVNALADEGYRVLQVQYQGEQVFVVMMAGG